MSKPTSSKAALLREVRTELECPICRELFTEPKVFYIMKWKIITTNLAIVLWAHLLSRMSSSRGECRVRNRDASALWWTTDVSMSAVSPNSSGKGYGHWDKLHSERFPIIYLIQIIYFIEMVEKVKSLHEDNDDEPEPCSKCLKLTSLHELFLCNSCPSNSAQAVSHPTNKELTRINKF